MRFIRHHHEIIAVNMLILSRNQGTDGIIDRHGTQHQRTAAHNPEHRHQHSFLIAKQIPCRNLIQKRQISP